MHVNTEKNIKTIDKNKDAIRVDRVKEARQHLKDGVYNSPKVIKRIVDKLLEEIG